MGYDWTGVEATAPEWLEQVSLGLIPGFSMVDKFGANEAVGTTMEPVTNGGIYRTPQVAGAVALRIAAGDAADTAGGLGAQEITLEVMDVTGAYVTKVLATAGTSASVPTDIDVIRFVRAWVSRSGTYATQVAASHAAEIVIENAAGTETWGTISMTGFPQAQTQISAYTIPLSVTGWIPTKYISIEANKAVDVFFFKRENILETAAPYTAMRAQQTYTGQSSAIDVRRRAFLGPFPALTDVGFMAKVATGTAKVNCAFDVILKADVQP